MKTDAQLKLDVASELAWDPAIDSNHVGVAVNEGVVTLTGHIETYAEQAVVERALERVAEVKAYALELEVRLAPDHRRSDAEIAQAAESALKWHALVPDDSMQVMVKKGRITLMGEVPWDHQRTAAMKAVRSLIGVVGVDNDIVLKHRPTPSNVDDRIRKALVRRRAGSERHPDRGRRQPGHAAQIGGLRDEHVATQGATSCGSADPSAGASLQA